MSAGLIGGRKDKEGNKDLDHRCIWYESECSKANIPRFRECGGYNNSMKCFAYLSQNMIKEREKEAELKKSMESYNNH